MLFMPKIRKNIAVCLILFLIFQFIPGTFGKAEGFDDYASKSPLILTKSVAQVDATLLTRESRKSPLHALSAEFYNSQIDNMYFADNTVCKSLNLKAPTDYRQQIKQTIPHHFHGSKYKEDHRFI